MSWKPGDRFTVENEWAPFAGQTFLVADIDDDGPEPIIIPSTLDGQRVNAAYYLWEIEHADADAPTVQIEAVTG